MDKLTVLLLVLISTAHAVNYTSYEDEDLSDVIETEVEDDQIWRVPQFDGTFEMMTEKEAKTLRISSEKMERFKRHLKNKQEKMRFFLHTRKNIMKWQEVAMDRPETLHRSNFNSSHPTRSVWVFLCKLKYIDTKISSLDSSRTVGSVECIWSSLT